MYDALRRMLTPSSMSGILCAALLTTAGTVGEAWAERIALLLSDAVPSYSQAMEGIQATQSPSTTIVQYVVSEPMSDARRIGQRVRVSRPDLVIAIGLRAAVVAKLEIPDIPTVFCLVLFPEQSDLPASNMVGISMHPSVDYQLTSIRSMVPKARRIGILHSPGTREPFLTAARLWAQQHHLELVSATVSQPQEVAHALKQLKAIDTLWVLPDPAVVTNQSVEFLVSYSFESHTPLFAFSPALVQHGAIGATYLDARDVGQQAGRLAAQMLRREADPRLGTLVPAEQPRLAVNVRVAAHFGLTLSPSTLQAASARFGTDHFAQGDAFLNIVP